MRVAGFGFQWFAADNAHIRATNRPFPTRNAHAGAKYLQSESASRIDNRPITFAMMMRKWFNFRTGHRTKLAINVFIPVLAVVDMFQVFFDGHLPDALGYHWSSSFYSI